MERAGEAGRKRGLMHGAMGLGILGQRQVTLRWANDTVWINDGGKGRVGQGVFSIDGIYPFYITMK